MVSSIRKRDARIVPFDVNKIAQAIFRAASSQGGKDYVLSLKIAAEVLERLNEQFEDAILSAYRQELLLHQAREPETAPGLTAAVPAEKFF